MYAFIQIYTYVCDIYDMCVYICMYIYIYTHLSIINVASLQGELYYV